MVRRENYQKGVPIREAIDRYGWENFKKDILCENLIRAGAEKLEKWFIAYYDSSNPDKGYNRFLGGLGKGARMSEATKVRSRETKIKLYEEHPEVKDKIRDTVNGLFESDPTYRERISKGVLAAMEKNPDLRRQLSENARLLWREAEYREKVCANMVKARENPEFARQESKRRKAFFDAHPEEKEAIRCRMKEYLANPENKSFLNSDHRAKPVICVETGEYYPSQMAAEKATGYTGVHKVCGGTRSVCGGYHWRYATEEEKLAMEHCG